MLKPAGLYVVNRMSLTGQTLNSLRCFTFGAFNTWEEADAYLKKDQERMRRDYGGLVEGVVWSIQEVFMPAD